MKQIRAEEITSGIVLYPSGKRVLEVDKRLTEIDISVYDPSDGSIRTISLINTAPVSIESE
jgi:hypothetical protein